MPRIPTVISSLDIETIPDFKLLSKIADIDVTDIPALLKYLKEGKSKDQTFKPIYNQIVECSIAIYEDTVFEIVSLGSGKNETNEEEILNGFTQVVTEATPHQKVYTWNGEGFDFPVMRMRAMKYGTNLGNYWNTEDDRKWNGYFNRYQTLHTDLKDILAGYGFGRAATLNETALLCGLPGKLGVGGEHVLETWLKGDTESIRKYCEIDALITFLLGLRFSLTQGIPKRQYEKVFYTVLDYLKDEQIQKSNEHFATFLEQWDQTTW